MEEEGCRSSRTAPFFASESEVIMENLYQRLQVLESEENPLSRLERLEALNGPLLSWYGEHARILPWRENPESYRVWISEIMLQQTRADEIYRAEGIKMSLL